MQEKAKKKVESSDTIEHTQPRKPFKFAVPCCNSNVSVDRVTPYPPKMKVGLFLIAAVLIRISGQAIPGEYHAPHHDRQAPPAYFKPMYREYRYNDAYHPEHIPPTMPRILVFVSKIRKMFLV
ncbi:hypothetical protein GHT06_014421 [Daphnia sinensis]|uniref:Uncharacterized protein n=1 Tax=Daphnia sinensis TaxID=1820382 RepID=A0AAD5KTN3_9CRUS|nr:hypothetical protein GHT06_014421 [Daphnia sinensis]